MRDRCVMILGGAGLTGAQIVRQVAREIRPETIIVASLYEGEVNELLEEVQREFPNVKFVPLWGDVFVRTAFTAEHRGKLLESPKRRRDLYDDLFGPLDVAYNTSRLASVIREHKPDVIVDSINTATAISYQDVETASRRTRAALDTAQHVVATLQAKARNTGADGDVVLSRDEWKALLQAQEDVAEATEILMVSQSVPQLIRHTQLIHRAMVEAGTRLYLKIGTTGTGGMGLNIPYTHGEDKPSSKLMSKTAVAFAQTGLMFLMARTPKGPIVKEIKPGAMVGYKRVTCRVIRQRGSDHPRYIYEGQAQPLSGTLLLRQDEKSYRRLGKMEMPVVDTGENGLFTLGEFETITSLQQMEFVTPEEIASSVILEIMGSNTGRDVIGAVDGAVLNPSYRAGYIRQSALAQLQRLERETDRPSVALGDLGPPELGKLLYEAYLLKLAYRTIPEALSHPPAEMAQQLHALLLERPDIRNLIVSIGLPIVTPDGKEILRGPVVRIPEGLTQLSLDAHTIDIWARKGWVDLRPSNWEVWQHRLAAMLNAARYAHGEGSAAITRRSYLGEDIRIGDMVAWLFNSDEYRGYRIK